jgi:hypothetical protein
VEILPKSWKEIKDSAFFRSKMHQFEPNWTEKTTCFARTALAKAKL